MNNSAPGSEAGQNLDLHWHGSHPDDGYQAGTLEPGIFGERSLPVNRVFKLSDGSKETVTQHLPLDQSTSGPSPETFHNN